MYQADILDDLEKRGLEQFESLLFIHVINEKETKKK